MVTYSLIGCSISSLLASLLFVQDSSVSDDESNKFNHGANNNITTNSASDQETPKDMAPLWTAVNGGGPLETAGIEEDLLADFDYEDEVGVFSFVGRRVNGVGGNGFMWIMDNSDALEVRSPRLYK